MKKIFMAMLGIAALSFTACEPKNGPEEPKEEDTTKVRVITSFPKKHLIEEFTGQTCGYCPYGMDCIHEFVGNDTNWVLVLHHYGYQADNFSVSGSKTITNALGVDGAPSMTINRAKTNYGQGNTVVFHPGYLPNTNKSQFADSTFASITIQNSYEASSRTLTVKVSGMVLKETPLKLTVLVKESGMLDTQADYYGSYEGWKEFRHTNAVRAFLTPEKGELITVTDSVYDKEYSLTLADKWVAENCMVVAFLAQDFQPVIQAEQRPVVAGSQGGADIRHGGVTPVPVADYYPEPNATDGPSTYSGQEADTLTYAVAQYTPYPAYGFNYWSITTRNLKKTISVNGTSCIPYGYLYLFTASDETDIPTGTYELNRSMEPGTAFAGLRDDATFTIDGCTYYYTSKAYYQQGYLVPGAEWLIVDGTLTIEESRWELVGHCRNGAPVHLVGTTKITNKGQSKAPVKAPGKKKQAIEYNTL